MPSNPIKRVSDEYHRRRRAEDVGLGYAYENRSKSKKPAKPIVGDPRGSIGNRIRGALSPVGKSTGKRSSVKLSGQEQKRKNDESAARARAKRQAYEEMSPSEQKRVSGAAKAVLEGLTGSSVVKLKLRGGKNADDVTFTRGDGDGRRPADEPASDAVRTGTPSGQRATSKAAAAVAKSQEKAKPGKVYEKTRSYWKDDGEKAKRFDMEMTGDEIRRARKEFLRTHPAARRAVENGTMSMGDVNIMVRRLSKRKKSRQG